ncbi:bile salt-activated lipase-like [Polymixia lowei]
MKTVGTLVAVALFLGTASATSLGVVYTEGGMVEGENIRLGFRRFMDVFKGIPFADFPGRFEKPKPHPGWNGVLKTTEYKKRCLQVTLLQTDTRGSEDCLYLNIWVPHGRQVSTGLPVMVWIYGGAFLVGGSMGANFLDNYLYSGQEIADRGDVIVVTLGYRVGTLGFLSSGDASGPGNYGLWDQQAAIAWVHRNIRSFGGDADNITIFGESAGGASVSFQTLTPHNKGLFKRAISQSGVALCPWAVNRNPRKFAEQVAQKVNCPTDDTMMTCLKMADPVALTLAGTINTKGSPEKPVVNNLLLSAVIDGDFLPDEPGNLFHNAADIDYIAGINNMDGHLFTALDIPSINRPLVDTAIEDMQALLGAYTKDKGKAGLDKAFAQYSSSWGTQPSKETIKRSVVDVGTDYIFLVPTQAALYLHAANAKSGRTYSYLFSEPNRLAGLAKPYPSWMGADHADDLQYVFGKPFTTPLAYWPSHRDVSGYMIAYWTNFAKTGDPNKGGLKVPATWPKFTSTAHQFLEINADTNSNYIKQKMRLNFVHFWTNILPNLASVNASDLVENQPSLCSVVMMEKLGLLVAVALFVEAVSAISLGLVSTEGGLVKGSNIRLGFRHYMDVFKGIPFADIPGRFEKPKRHPGWGGTLKATEYRKRCVQVNLIMTSTRGSEDCLYLNVWVPHRQKVSTDLPVMVWIYGGGYLAGGSMGANFLDNYLYSGQEIADRGDVIVVTLGYRVGTLGFLSTGDSSLPGNYGLWDQQAAIAWVHRNIRSFGGNPDNITVFGESAGAASVSFQTITPHNKGLFKRAISQSGVALCPWAIIKNPRRLAEEVAVKVNCPTDENMVACLKMTDPAVLTLAGSLSLASSPDDPLVSNLVLSAVVDGDFLPDEPSKLFHNAADIDYIAGINDMDGHLFTGLDVPSINSPVTDTPVEDMKRLLASYTKEKGKAGLDSAFSTYTLDWGTKPSQQTIKKTIVEIGTDFIFLVPTQTALYLHAANATSGRTYSYVLSEPNRMAGLARPYPSWMGADHADDLQYMFGKPFTTPLAYWPSHRDLSGYMIAYWTNFAKTG